MHRFFKEYRYSFGYLENAYSNNDIRLLSIQTLIKSMKRVRMIIGFNTGVLYRNQTQKVNFTRQYIENIYMIKNNYTRLFGEFKFV